MTNKAQRAPQPRRYIGYYRVSTGDQSASGLGLDAQISMVREYMAANPGRLITEFSEVMSGRRSDRPQLAKALSLCKITRSTLVIARLDRLSRSVQMIVDLMESGVEFVAVDFPHANKFTIHILAALAEYESSLNSDRMKSIAKALRERGVKRVRKSSSQPKFPPGCWEASARSRKARMEARDSDLGPMIWAKVNEGKSYAVKTREFNASHVVPPRDKPWTKHSVWRIAQATRDLRARHSDGTPTLRQGCAQAKVRAKVAEASELLIALWRQGKSNEEISSALAAVNVRAPWGGKWSATSIRSYLLRALNARSLREARGMLQ